MSFKIKEKLLSIVGKEKIKNKEYRYVYEMKLKMFLFLGLLAGSVDTVFFLYFNDILKGIFTVNPLIGAFGLVFSIVFGISAVALTLLYTAIFIDSVWKRKNFLKTQKNIINIEQDLDDKFGSVDNAISIYREIGDLNIDLSDENFEKILNETKYTIDKRRKVKDISERKLEKINERIQRLMKEKEEIKFKSSNKQGKILNIVKEIEYKGVDISMDLSAIKERVKVNV